MKLPRILYPSILIIIWCLTSTTIIKANETDRLALLAIKSKLHDPVGFTSSWNGSVNLCNWRGVKCGKRHQRVSELDLSNKRIGGSLSPYIGNLSFLQGIYLHSNNLKGEIPQEVGRLFRLQSLEIANNSFGGTIPASLSNCSNLVEIQAFQNNFVGEILVEIGNLRKLVVLSVHSNSLTGQIPASIGNLTSLQTLQLYSNNLHGTIPGTFGQLKSLSFLSLDINELSGTIPPSVYNISSLNILVLAENQFHGSFPHDLGIILPGLTMFIVPENNFDGPIPHSLSNASNLQILDMADNNLSGKVSLDFSNLKNLRRLNLGQNNLGDGVATDLGFVSSLTNCSNLEQLGLYGNRFGGMIPHSITNLSTKLTGIAIGINQISGTIPPGIGNLVNLNVIGMESNQLSGTIPHEIGELKNLQALDLTGNNLQGSIPTTLGNLTLLNRLWLGSNKLGGNIPSSLGNCQNLMLLNVSKNELTGTVPQQILGIATLSTFLDLSDNLLSGLFPSEVGSLKNLIALNISGNQFSGEIPVNLASCTSLEYLYMQGNSFNGSIPSSLSSLKSLKELDLSKNNLSGQIPQYLENLSFLRYLNLSYNHFDGEVPTKGIFTNSTEISLVGNQKLCGGSHEFHLPSCRSKGSKNRTITILKVVIPVIVSCLILSACFFAVFIRRRKSANRSTGLLQMEEQFPTVSYADLSKATNGFSSLSMIGQGSYGVVYKGNLGETGLLVAVKVFNLKQKGASKSFMAECEALRNIRHRNLMKIVTICSSIDFQGNDFKALVYEYMQNGSLQDWLHRSNNQPDMRNLGLIQRLNIAIDVASAIEYLHHHCQPPIVHGDIKPSNVLLDHDLVAHVGDFGLAKFIIDRSTCTDPESQASSIGIRGTVGYVAPEYGMGSAVSLPGDVYSVGILLLEMFTGRQPTDNMFSDGLTLHGFVKMALPEKVIEIVDTSFLLEETTGNNNVASLGEGRIRIEECLVAVMRIGVLCSMESPVERMEMTDVVPKLCAARKKLLGNRV